VSRYFAHFIPEATGSSSVLTGSATAANATGTGAGLVNTNPVYTLTGSATAADATGSGAGLQITNPVYSLSGSATAPAATGSGAGLTTTATFFLSGAGTAAYATGSGAGITVLNPRTLSGSAIAADATGSGAGLVVIAPVSTLSGAGSAATATGTGTGLTVVNPSSVALKWVWVGNPAATGATIVARTDAVASVKIRYSVNSDLSASTDSAAQTTASAEFFTKKFTLSGLTANTQYSYAVVIDGTVVAGKNGKFKTLPSSGPWQGKILMSSCAVTSSDGGTSGASPFLVWDRIATQNPDLFIHMGDMWYETVALGNNESEWYPYLDSSLGIEKQMVIYRNRWTLYIPDDHDGGANNRSSTYVGKPALLTAYQRFAPSPALPNVNATAPDNNLSHATVVGRVRIIMLDVRSSRTSVSATDNSSKTCLGATQKQWFKDQLLAMKQAGEVGIVVMPNGWVGSALSTDTTFYNDDGWSRYNTERVELSDFFIANSLNNRFVIIAGDMHGLAYDDGSNSNYATGVYNAATGRGGAGGPRVYHCAALDQSSSVKGGPYSGSTSSGRGRYGTFNVVDAGGATVSLEWSGYLGVSGGTDSLWLTNTAVLDVSPTRTLTGSAQAGAATGTGTGLQVVNPVTLSGSAQVANATGTGTGLSVANPVTLSGSAQASVATGSGAGLTFVAPAGTRTLSGSAEAGAAIGSGSGITVLAPVFTFSGSAQASAAIGTGAGIQFIAPARTLSGSAQTANALGSGTGLLFITPGSVLSARTHTFKTQPTTHTFKTQPTTHTFKTQPMTHTFKEIP